MKIRLKYLLIPLISLGFVFFPLVQVNYYCSGWHGFEQYYGSPFLFKQASQVTSMSFNYSISGLLANMALWSVVLYLLHSVMGSLLNNRLKRRLYRSFVGLLLIFSVFLALGETLVLANSFDWYWEVDKEAETNGMKCLKEYKFWWK